MDEAVTLPAGAALEERSRSLLIEMLVCVRHTQDTPLYFGIDGQRVAGRALSLVEAGQELCDCGLLDAPRVVATIERLARVALGAPALVPVAPVTRVARGGLPSVRARPEPLPLQSLLAEWLEQTHQRMRAVHPLALDLLGLRVRGEGDREIATQLDFGLRLTRRITADMRSAW